MKRRTRPAKRVPPRAVTAPSVALLAVLLGGGVLLAYLGTYGYPLVFDDNIIANPHLGGWATWLAPRWLSYGTFVLTRELAGLHIPLLRLQNVLLHAATAAALLFLCRGLLAGVPHRPAGADRDIAALAAAGVFAFHPAGVYAVAYLAERSIMMATLFSLLSLTAWLRGLRAPDARWLAAAVALYFLAVSAKEHAIMLPAVALALAVAVRGEVRAPRRWIAAALLVEALIAVLVAAKLRGLLGTTYEPHAAQVLPAAAAGLASAEDHVFARSVVTQALLFFKYLLLWIAPLPAWMSVDLRERFAPSLAAFPEIAGAVAYLAYGALALRLLLARGPAALAGFAMLFPWLLYWTEFSVVRVQEPFVIYRSYLWLPGFCLLLAVAATRLARKALFWGALALCLALAGVMRERIATFATPLALWDDAVRKQADERLPFADRAIGNRGVALLREGRTEEAMGDFDRAVRLNPQNVHAYASRAGAHAQRDDLERARQDLDEAIRLHPRFAEAYAERCALRLRRDDSAGALADCDTAYEIEPRFPNTRVNRGVIYARRGEPERALAEFSAALEVHPQHGIALLNRAATLMQLGRAADSRRDLERGCRAGFEPACQRLRPQK